MMTIGSSSPSQWFGRFDENLRKPLISKRISLNREVSMRFPHLPGVLTGTCGNLSMTGMFVRSRNLAIPGTSVAFEMSAQDQGTIHGQAEVIWVRDQEEGPSRPRGMGLRFIGLNRGSTERIRAAVEKRILNGGVVSDLDEMMSVSEPDVQQSMDAMIDTVPAGTPPLGASLSSPVPSDSAVPSEKLHPYAGAASARSSETPSRWLPVLAAVIGAAVLIAGLIYFF